MLGRLRRTARALFGPRPPEDREPIRLMEAEAEWFSTTTYGMTCCRFCSACFHGREWHYRGCPVREVRRLQHLCNHLRGVSE